MSLTARRKASSISQSGQPQQTPSSSVFSFASPAMNGGTPSLSQGGGGGEFGGGGGGVMGNGNGNGNGGGMSGNGNGNGGGMGDGGNGGIGMNNLAVKTAALGSSQTLYQTCSDTRRRLRMVQGYERFIDLPPEAPRLDVVTHVWQSFRLGSSLCHLFNMLLPTFDPSSAPAPLSFDFPDFDYPEGNGVLTWGTLPENQKKCKRPAANFLMALTNLKREGKWSESDPLWALHELFQDDTGGLVKVLRSIGLLLDQLPPSAWIGVNPMDDPSSPMTAYASTASLDRSGFFGEGGFGNGGGPSMTRHQSTQSFSQGGMGTGVGSVPHTRPGSSASTYHNGHSSSLSMSSSGHAAYPGGPRSPYDTPSTSSVPLPNGRIGIPLSINTSLDGGFKSGPQSAAATGPIIKAGAFDFGPVGHGEAAMQVWEIVKTEKKYVQELEILQAYSQTLIQNSIVAPDTVHQMFSNISKLVDFQRRFLTQLETEYEPVTESGPDAWNEGRWGFPFLHFERDFEVYEPYCANYMNAIEMLEKEAPNLARHNLSLTVAELRPFLFSPIQRLCKYPLLLSSLSKSTANGDYRYKEELTDGLDVAKRIAESVNETLRQNSNNSIVQELQWRVRDWKSHHISEFGNLLLEGRFMVTKADMDRDYEVYLFEKMILCCKEIVPDKKDKRSTGKSGSILKKQASTASSPGPAKKNQLSLKGRIYVNNLTHIQQVGKNGNYALAVYWRQQDNPNEFENFVLHVNNSEQLNQWDSQITKLMKLDSQRRAERDRRSQGARRQILTSSNFALTPGSEYPQAGPGQNGFFPVPGTPGWDEDRVSPSTSASSTPYSALSRRTPSQQGIPRPPADRTSVGTTRSRSSADDHSGMMTTQWKNHAHPPIPNRHGSDPASVTEASFGTPGGLPMRHPRGVPGPATLTRNFSEDLRGQHSNVFAEDVAGLEILRTDSATPNARYAAGMALRGSSQSDRYGSPDSTPQPPILRNRSASSPHVYQVPKMSSSETSLPPITAGMANLTHWDSNSPHSYSPVQTTPPPPNPRRVDSHETEPDFKRSSNGSASTELSEDSSRSPETPYGGNSADLTGVMIGGRAGSGESVKVFIEQVIVKVHYNRDVFKLAVPATIRCNDLKTKVTRKVQMCGGAQSGAPVKCYYLDEDKERLRLDGDDDLMTLFEPVLRGDAREVELEVRA